MALRFLPLDERGEARGIRAAAYVRMSTDMQCHSIANQMQVIEEYAARHAFSIVQTYADPGRSGLSLEGRPALQALLHDIQNGSDFSVVLIYDVTRWGRFQDVDESAFYEYQCRRAGVAIIYCAEPFENDGSPLSSILKGLKRIMAAEYSRELSRKVFLGQSRIAAMGFHGGGPTSYGLKRLLLDPSGGVRLTLEPGERKTLTTDRVVLSPGVEAERETVRRVFRLYVNERLTKREICRRLNDDGVPLAGGGQWNASRIARMLANERYLGTSVYNQSTSQLAGRRRVNPRDRWILAPNAFEAIVDRQTFRRAQQRTRLSAGGLTKPELVAALKRLIETQGRLSASVIDACEALPSKSTVCKYFGSLTSLYAELGYRPRHDLTNVLRQNALARARSAKLRPSTAEEVAEKRRSMIAALADLLKREGRLSLNMINNDSLTPSATSYARYFGSLLNAYAMVGYKFVPRGQQTGHDQGAPPSSPE